MISLERVNEQNYQHVFALELADNQKCFVSSNLIFFLSMLSYKYLSSYFLLLFIPLGILFMLFFKHIPFINKKAKITICIELICLFIPKINMIVILALCENIILYLMTAKEKVNS